MEISVSIKHKYTDQKKKKLRHNIQQNLTCISQIMDVIKHIVSGEMPVFTSVFH